MFKKDKCNSCMCGIISCDSALERIYTIQGSKKKTDSDQINTGCPWFINSAEHNYSFWNYIKTLDEPVADKDICDLLMIDGLTLHSTFDSAVSKLKKLKNTPELQELKEALLDKMNSISQDDTVYLPDEFMSVVDGAMLEAKKEELKDPDADLFQDKPRKKRMNSQPLHIGGKKTDIYFSTKKTSERMKKEKEDAKKAKKNK